ncbi:TPA: hypothetical protein DIS56_00090 [Candidatus Saccharibacteria bacterium]|nr:MAG: hypothetical protein A3F05_01500 [Candidatus Saccharibacteria bacterium RIFCSPHIGHO2_12_FULL_47_17]HCM51528.1 hypothetical protein [Candidatus Saccharibacteria bacterium]
METAQLNRPLPRPTQDTQSAASAPTTSLAPEIVEDLPVKIPAGGQTTRFSNTNPFQPPSNFDSSFSRSQPETHETVPKSQLQKQTSRQPQANTSHKPITETVLVVTLSLILIVATFIFLG